MSTPTYTIHYFHSHGSVSRSKKPQTVTGREAWSAFRSQPHRRCACGTEATEEHGVFGSHKGSPAQWHGCPHCGRAVGEPIRFPRG